MDKLNKKIKGGDHVMVKEGKGYYKVYDYVDGLYIFFGPDKIALDELTIMKHEQV